MKIRACPLCRQVMLVRGGEMLSCDGCGFPMTRHLLGMTLATETEESEGVMDFQRR